MKPRKEPHTPSSYQPVTLLCHTYKLYERIFLNKLNPTIDDKFIKEQAGFRPSKFGIEPYTQYIENGFEKKKVTGVSFFCLNVNVQHG